MTGGSTAASIAGRPLLSIVGGRLLTDTGLGDGEVMLDGELIRSVDRWPSGADPVIDADGLIVAPGFVDLQINGGHGLDLASDPASMWALGRLLPRHGVTSFLPTIVSSPSSVTDAAIEAFNQRPVDHQGAEPLGLHFEGPMLNPERAGAHRKANLSAVDRSVIGGWNRSTGVALVTMAPELPGAHPLIAELVAGGVVVSAGHSSATAAQARAGFDAGATMITHLFNAMAPLGHRAPNLVGIGLSDPRAFVGLIVDGVHVDPTVIDIAWKAKGPSGTVLVTDAVAPMGQGPGVYELGRNTITADDVRVVNEAGVLAGSVLTMDRAVRNLIDYTGCPTGEALVAAARTPTDVLGEPSRGRLTAGAIADLVLLDQQLEVQITICRGRVSYVAESAVRRLPIEDNSHA